MKGAVDVTRPETIRPAARAAASRLLRRVLGGACAFVLVAGTAFGQVRAVYLYTLSNFTGRIPYDWARVYVDQERDETYVVYQNLIRIFSASGMEVFSFGDGLGLGQILDVAVDPEGNILVLSFKDGRSHVTRCSYRGVPLGTIEITGLPDGLAFSPNRMMLQGGRLYFVNLASSSLIITDGDGAFREHVALMSLIDSEERQKEGAELVGFTVDRDGNVFFTVPVLFKVFKLSPDRTVESFGRSGSAPGRFGVLAGIAVDDRGNLLVVDKLKCVVMVFDKAFTFLTEFGYRGAAPSNLIAPDDIAVDRRGRLYVTQGRKRGVGVFALNYG